MLRAASLVFLALVTIPLGRSQDARLTTSSDGRGAGAILKAGGHWELLGEGYQLTADSAVDNGGTVYFTDSHHSRIMRIDPAGKITTWKENSGGAHGIAFGPDGRLYAGQHEHKRVVAFSPDGLESVIAEGVQSHHLTVTPRNEIYLSEPPAHVVWLVKPDGSRRAVHAGMEWPRGVRSSNTQPLLAIADSRTPWVWTFQIGPDGSLLKGKQFCRLEAGSQTTGIDSGGLAFDSQGFLYVATSQGVQVCDPQGRVSAILRPPGAGDLTNVFFAGPGLQWLYVTGIDRIYRRPAKRQGVALRSRSVALPPKR